MQDSERVLVIGGGIGGLAAAAALRAGGAPVEVFERQPELRELGTGVGIQRVAAQALSMLGLQDALREISGPGFKALRLVSWRDGRTLTEVPWHREVVAVHRGELLEIIARAVGDPGVVHCGMECVGFRQDATGVSALFADGHEERGAALVGADGLQSVIRTSVIGDGPPRYPGATVWRALPEFTHKVPRARLRAAGVRPGVDLRDVPGRPAAVLVGQPDPARGRRRPAGRPQARPPGYVRRLQRERQSHAQASPAGAAHEPQRRRTLSAWLKARRELPARASGG